MRAYESKGRLALISEGFEGRLIVAGDIHGDLGSFLRIRELFSRDDASLLIFLGDYADRGPHGLEVVEGVRELLEGFEDRVIALKGNHEDYRGGRPNFYPCDLISEVEFKRKAEWKEFFAELRDRFLDRLYLAALLPGRVLFVHGGVSSNLRALPDLIEPPWDVEEDVLWSDPSEWEGELPNPRGAGVLFGPDVSGSVVEALGVRHIIRSHEPAKALAGPHVQHSGRVITLSSTRVYGGRPFVLSFGPNLTREPDWVERSVVYLNIGQQPQRGE